MSNDKDKHDTHTRMIGLNPSYAGLTGILLSTGEANIFDEGKIISQPDNLLFDPSTQTLYNVEYKCNHTHSQYEHAKYQLHNRERKLQKIYNNWRIVNLYIFENYKIEVIK